MIFILAFANIFPQDVLWPTQMNKIFSSIPKVSLKIITAVTNKTIKETKEYIYLLDKQDISRILTSIGLDKKEITKLI